MIDNTTAGPKKAGRLLFGTIDPAEVRRIPDAATLKAELDAWRVRRNARNVKTNWHSTIADAV